MFSGKLKNFTSKLYHVYKKAILKFIKNYKTRGV